MSGLWWKRPQCGCRDLCVTALWGRLHAKTSVSLFNIIPYSWIQSPGDLWEHLCTELKINRGLKTGCNKIKISLWVWTFLQLCIFKHCYQNKQWLSFHFSSRLVFHHPVSLDRNSFSTFSCLDIWPAALTTTITQRVLLRMYWKSFGWMRAIIEGWGGVGWGWLIAWRRCINGWFCCCLGKYNKQTMEKDVYAYRPNPFFSSSVQNTNRSVLWQKVLNLGFPGRRNVWKVNMENGPFFPSSYHTWFIWDIPGRSCHCRCLCLPTRRPDFRLARQP